MSINADEPWREKQPVRGAARAVRVPVPQSFQLANGLTVIALPQTGGVPVVSASLVVRSGSDANPVDKPGLASFTAALLDQGTATRIALQLADEVAQIGASLTTGHRRGRVDGVDQQPQQEFPCGAGASGRRRAPSELPRRRSRARACDGGSPISSSSAAIRFRSRQTSRAKALYGTHPYGFSETGTVESNKQLTRDDLQGFWRQNFVPGNAALVVSGADPAGRNPQAGGSVVRRLAERHRRRPRSSARHQPRRRGWSSSIARARRRRNCASQRSACRATAPITCRCAS